MTHRDEADQPNDPDLADDFLAAFIIDGQKHFVRWHSAAEGPDSVVATTTGKWAFADPHSCVSSWPSWLNHDESESEVIDLDEVTVWLRRQRLSVPCEDLLNAWNWAGDVASGLGLRWGDRGALADRCYDKLHAGAGLRGASLRGTHFAGCDLRDVDFGGADLTDAEFGYVMTHDPNYGLTDVTGATWQGACLKRVTVDSVIGWPEG